MGAVGGSIKEVSIGGRVLAVAADADATVKLGGYESETQMNGNQTSREQLTLMPWSITGLAVSIDEAKGDHDFLQDCADGVNADDDGYYPCTVTYVNNLTRAGRGKPQGEVPKGSKASTVALSLAGPGKLELQ